MKITTFFILIVSLSLFSTTLSAQTTLQAGQVYTGGTHLKVQEAGISFKTPIGWNGILPQGSTFFIMTAPDQISNIIVSANYMTAAKATEQMNNPIPLGQGLTLIPAGQTTQNGNQLSNTYTITSNGQTIYAFVETVIGSYGIGASFIGASDETKLPQVKNKVREMIQNLQFFEVKQAKPQSPQNADAGSWAKYMQGKHIVKFYTTSGYTKKQMMWFCSDGSCRYSSNSSGYTQGGGPSFAFQNADIGTWTAQGSTNGTGIITIQWQDGTSSSSQIYIQGDELRINGERWLRDSNQFCN